MIKNNIIFLILEGGKAKTEFYFCEMIKEIIVKKIKPNNIDLTLIKSNDLKQNSFGKIKEFLDRKLNSEKSKNKNWFIFQFDLDEDANTIKNKIINFNLLKKQIKEYINKNICETLELVEKSLNIETNFYYPFTGMTKRQFQEKYPKWKTDKKLLIKCIKNNNIDIEHDKEFNEDIFKDIANKLNNKNKYSIFFNKLHEIIEKNKIIEQDN